MPGVEVFEALGEVLGGEREGDFFAAEELEFDVVVIFEEAFEVVAAHGPEDGAFAFEHGGPLRWGFRGFYWEVSAGGGAGISGWGTAEGVRRGKLGGDAES